MYVVCLLFGFGAHECKLVESDALTQANSYGFVITVLMMGLKTLASSGTDGIGSVMEIAAVMVLMATVAMGLMALLTSKLLRQSFFYVLCNCTQRLFGLPD